MSSNPKEQEVSSSAIWKFLIPSLIGVALFMTPVPVEDGVTIPIAVLADWLQGLLAGVLPEIMTIVIIISTLGVFVQKFAKPDFMTRSEFSKNLFDINIFWTVVRIIASILAVMVLFQIGPEWVWDDYTGGLLLRDLLPLLFTIFIFAGLFLPLLLNFGLLEFVGSLLIKIMRPLFTLPGRSSIDSLTSWLGDGTIGVILTNKQYEEGFYSKREAAVIASTFSVVSITFSLVIIAEVDLAHMFVPFYATVIFAGFVAALIMPRIPPLSLKKTEYADGGTTELDESIPSGHSPVSWGLKKAKERADKNHDVKTFFRDGAKNVLDMILGVAPVVMAIGTIAVIIAEFTPVFAWLGAPYVPLLELMRVPEAAAASETLVVGFADMFLPAIFAGGIESEMTRFIIACVSVTQLIYLSEVGGVILGSKIPLRFWELIVIFVLRTLITLPVITLIAHIIF